MSLRSESEVQSDDAFLALLLGLVSFGRRIEDLTGLLGEDRLRDPENNGPSAPRHAIVDGLLGIVSLQGRFRRAFDEALAGVVPASPLPAPDPRPPSPRDILR